MSYAKLFAQIERELQKMQRAVYENEQLIAASESLRNNPIAYNGLISGIALNLQSFYTGAERVLSAIAKQVDNTVPKGAQWHQDLLA